MRESLVAFSKFLSLVLRHHPERIGLELDNAGWANVEDLLAKANLAGVALTDALLHQVVEQNDKKRFALSDDGRKIRASQGHSVQVDLQLAPLSPPNVLYHGTAQKFLDSIREQGLTARGRNHVHLSSDSQTARRVGERHGKPVVLTILAGQMARDGHRFFRSDNGVWLTEAVPVRYIDFSSRTDSA